VVPDAVLHGPALAKAISTFAMPEEASEALPERVSFARGYFADEAGTVMPAVGTTVSGVVEAALHAEAVQVPLAFPWIRK
jgi:hypothetical protein